MDAEKFLLELLAEIKAQNIQNDSLLSVAEKAQRAVDQQAALKNLVAKDDIVTRVIYSSRSKATAADEKKILRKAVSKNLKTGITGVLFSADRQFVQILECKDEVVVAKLIEKIKADPRHDAMYILSRARGKKRIFTNWSMASIALDPDRFNQMLEILPTLDDTFEALKRRILEGNLRI